MRIMYDSCNVMEFNSIDGVKSWSAGKNSTKDLPTKYTLQMDDEYVGEYKLDGNEETFNAAVKNLEKICEQLLVKGYCKADDFENFEWF